MPFGTRAPPPPKPPRPPPPPAAPGAGVGGTHCCSAGPDVVDEAVLSAPPAPALPRPPAGAPPEMTWLFALKLIPGSEFRFHPKRLRPAVLSSSHRRTIAPELFEIVITSRVSAPKSRATLYVIHAPIGGLGV